MADAGEADAGAVAGGPRLLLRLEGLGILALALAAHAQAGDGWGRFALLALLPDLALLAYLAGPRVGALAYNATHSLLGPLALGALGLWAPSSLGSAAPALQAGALAWAAHIGADRALGYGLKYAHGFGFTHLGPLGRAAGAKRPCPAAS